MKHYLLGFKTGWLVLSFTFLCFAIGLAQTANLNVISVHGGYEETPDFSISWSVGELSISTQTNFSAILTQGFQQSYPLTTLPIEMLNFYGEEHSNGNELKWETSSEINNDFFTLLRSTDGQSFSEIANINGAGSSYAQLHYQYLDIEAPTGRSYYQLKQTDFNGQTSLSEIITLERLALQAVGNLDMQIFPNPTSNELTVNFKKTLKDDLRLHIHDYSGRFIQKLFIPAGQQKINISLVDLPNGIYFLSVQNAKDHIMHSTNRIVKSSL